MLIFHYFLLSVKYLTDPLELTLNAEALEILVLSEPQLNLNLLDIPEQTLLI